MGVEWGAVMDQKSRAFDYSQRLPSARDELLLVNLRHSRSSRKSPKHNGVRTEHNGVRAKHAREALVFLGQ